MKKLLSVIIAAAMLFAVFPIGAEDALTVTVNGEETELSQTTYLRYDGTLYVPFRSIAELMELDVTWDKEKREAHAVGSTLNVTVPIGEKYVKQDNMKKSISAENAIIDNYTYMPLDALSIFNITSDFDEENGALALSVPFFHGKYYLIRHKESGKVMMPEGAATGDGPKIVLVDADGSDAQIWQFMIRGENLYRPINQKSLRSMDMPNWRSDEGLGLIQYGNTEGTNQWVHPVSNGDGTYSLIIHHSMMYLSDDGEGNVVQYSEFDSAAASWELVEVAKTPSEDELEAAAHEDDPYDGKYFDIDGSAYKFILQGNGYVLEDKATGAFLTEDGKTEVFSEAGIFALDGETLTCGEKSLEFSDVKVSPESYSSGSNLGGKYYTLTSLSGGKMSVEGDSENNSARIITAQTSAEDFDVWAFTTVGSGCYVVINKASGRCLDIPEAKTDAGIPLTQFDNYYNPNQKFLFEDAGNGAYYIRPLHSGLYLTALNGYITQEKFTGRNSQKFTLAEVGETGEVLMGAGATMFLLKGEDDVTNAKIAWSEVGAADNYDIYRSKNGGGYEFVTNSCGTTVDDYDLEVGATYKYTVYALNGSELIASDDTNEITPYPLPADLSVTSNIEISGLNRPNTMVADGVYYRFEQWWREDGGGFLSLMMRTSTDDVTYSDPIEVLHYKDILAHPSCSEFEGCRFESVNYRYNPVTKVFAFIAHFEADGGYGTARISIATMKLGDEKMTYHGAIRPGGDDCRDMNMYVDDDEKHTAYIMAAAHGNANLAIYRLSEDWSTIEERVALINNNRWRELPNVIKDNGIYYLFTSGCAGWYPTHGMYNSATSMEGPWSELRSIGNTSTFSSQSGGVFPLKDGGKNYIMNSYRWMYYWQDAVNKSTQNLRFPIIVKDGYAFYDYFEELYYNYDNDVLVPVQRGRVLSQSKPAAESDGVFYVNNGANDGNYDTAWYNSELAWPYIWEVDLGQAHSIDQVQMSWLIWIGSEPYYQYKIEGSVDGENYFTLADKTEGYTSYGFTVDNVSGDARYVRVTVTDAKPRSGENDYPSSLFEVKVLGK